MSYVKNALASGEQVLHKGHFHWAEKIMALAFCCVIIGIFPVIRMWTAEIAVTNRGLIFKCGWIARKTEEISLARIEEVNLRQGVLGRILGFGHVQVQGMGAPMRFKRELQQAQARMEPARS